jgi:hypothetical protein
MISEGRSGSVGQPMAISGPGIILLGIFLLLFPMYNKKRKN